MQELYFPEAIVLDREDANGFDSRYSIYAKGFGKFLAKATSARKITSKLAPHLEPGNLVQIRVVGNGHFQVVDVLKSSRIEVRCSDLYLLNQLLPDQDFEFGIWEMLVDVRDDRMDRNVRVEGGGNIPKFSWMSEESKGSPSGIPSGQVHQNLNWREAESSPSLRSGREPFDWKRVLRVLGWDPEHGVCEVCQIEKPEFFDVGTQGFFCEKCYRGRRERPNNFSFRKNSRDLISLS